MKITILLFLVVLFQIRAESTNFRSTPSSPNVGNNSTAGEVLNGFETNNSQIVQQAMRKLAGKITDTDGVEIVGASVSMKETKYGTITDSEGNFSFAIPEEGGILLITYIGYLTQEIKIAGQTFVNITLKDDQKILDEVVVIGYGTQKKANLTGSVGYIGGHELENRSVPNVTQALQGKVAGLNISSSDGVPGSTQNINLRGYTGFSGTTTTTASPLIVIDGVQGGRLSDLEMNDVESISFLKDAASAAIYGSSAPYGVVIVTTKKGRSGTC